ncbi:MAG: DUF6073 family protein [Pyrinomonadaceae bacterium]|nr:DUF6073 family protein [Pyrinomonadaceae bacterium]
MYQEKNGFAVALERNNETNLLPNPKTVADLRVQAMPEGGVDKLNFIAWDTIEVLGFGEETIELRGHYVIDRANPTDSDWEKASVDIRMAEMSVKGVSSLFGPVRASVNHDIGIQSRGQVRAGTVYPGVADSPKLCEMEGYMKFELPEAAMTVFNKEKILLQHKITHIPPVGQGGGTGEVAIKLYNVEDPDGPHVAVLKQVRTHIGSWVR